MNDDNTGKDNVINLKLLKGEKMPFAGEPVDTAFIAMAREIEFIRRDSKQISRLSKDIETSAEMVSILGRRIVEYLAKD